MVARALTFAAVVLSVASDPCERNVTFTGPWSGGDAWLVDYTGPFENDRPPHVQVGTKNVTVHAGLFACLSNIHTAGSKAIEWDVDGVWNSALNEPAHMTVYYGPNAKSKINDFRGPAPPARAGVTCEPGTYYRKYGPDCGADCCECVVGNYCPGGTPKQEMFPCPAGTCSPAGASAETQCVAPACSGPGPSPGPTPSGSYAQIHLSLTGVPTEMAVSFAVPTGTCRGSASVAYGTAPGALSDTASAEAVPFTGGGQSNPLCTYFTTLTGLRMNTDYYYSIEGGETFQFRNQNSRVGGRVYVLVADMGVANDQAAAQLAYEANNDTYDSVLYAGDLAYNLDDRGGDNGNDFMNIMQPIASRKPLHCVVGNHEEYFNFTSFKARFAVYKSTLSKNSGSNNLFWYSFDDDLVHFVNINTELFQYGGADPQTQYAWLEADLAAVDRSKTPWLVVQGHKNAFMTQTVFTKFDSLFRKYGVNLYLNGRACAPLARSRGRPPRPPGAWPRPSRVSPSQPPSSPPSRCAQLPAHRPIQRGPEDPRRLREARVLHLQALRGLRERRRRVSGQPRDRHESGHEPHGATGAYAILLVEFRLRAPDGQRYGDALPVGASQGVERGHEALREGRRVLHGRALGDAVNQRYSCAKSPDRRNRL
jgi:hypothetical protein